MPTAYTEKIKEGISFQDFVLRCARAIDHLSFLEDSPNEPLPDELIPNHYYLRELNNNEANLQRLKKFSAKGAAAECKRVYKNELAAHELYIKNNKDLKDKYRAMLKEVKSWNPPFEYLALKNFMIDQINLSIQSDCHSNLGRAPKQQTTEKWLAASIKEAQKMIKECQDNHNREVLLTAEANKWLSGLRECLSSTPKNIK